MRRFSWFNVTSLTLGFAFLYLPMVLLVVYSFNESRLVTVWAGFSTKWYGELLRNEEFLDAAWVTLKVAVFSSTIATVLGTMAAYVLVRAGRFRGRTLFSGLIFAPLVILVIWMGVWPMPFLDIMASSVDALLVPFVEADAAGAAVAASQ